MRISFDPFALDPDTHQLTRDGQDIHLSPKAFELLATLIRERPNVLSKSVLQQRLWPDTFVAEANLSNLVAEIRTALGDSARAARYLRTVHKIGYSFCGEVTQTETSRPAVQPTGVLCWLEWGFKRFPLVAGEHVIGRDPDVEIRLDASTVSRRHARLTVTPERAVLEDCGSKNGTFRGDERITGPVSLADGDDLRIGSVRVIFHVRAHDSTETQQETRL